MKKLQSKTITEKYRRVVSMAGMTVPDQEVVNIAGMTVPFQAGGQYCRNDTNSQKTKDH